MVASNSYPRGQVCMGQVCMGHCIVVYQRKQGGECLHVVGTLQLKHY